MRCYDNYQQDNWADLFPFAEVADNNALHSSTGFTPFIVTMGQDFVPIPELPQAKQQTISLAEKIRELQSTWPVVHKALEKPHGTYKKQVDKKHSKPKDFNIGNNVYLSIKCLQSRQPSKKLGPKYVGLFPITKVINLVTVQLGLPKSLRYIQPVFC